MQEWTGKTSTEEFIELAERFLAHLSDRRQSVSTVKKREQDLRRFFLHLDDVGIERLHDVTLADLQGFHKRLTDHGYKDSVIEGSLRAVKLFFDFLQDDGVLFENPARKLKIPKSPVILGHVLTEGEIKRLITMPNLATNEGMRDRAIMETLYSTGIRQAELLGLAVCDVDLDRMTVRVTGKRKKVRVLPLGRQAVKYLNLYLQHARPWLLRFVENPPEALWISRRRVPVDKNTFSRMLTGYCREAGVELLGVHTFRRSCATHMLQNGAHPVVVAQLLGHSNLSSLAHYLRTTITELKQAHARTVLGR